MRVSILFILLLTIFLQPAIGQTFSARISSKTIGKNDRLQVEYIAVNGQLSQFRLPAFPGWIVLSGPNLASSQTMVNGVVSQRTSYSVILLPTATGRLIVPAASALLNNQPVRTSPIPIEVKKTPNLRGQQRQPATQTPPRLQQQRAEFGSDQFLRAGENARDKINDNITVRAVANKKSAVVGEPILITYKLYTRLRSQSRVVSQPSFSGVTVIEMTTDNPMASREVLDGKMYNSYIVRRVQLIPLQEGILNIPEAAIENKVAFYDASSVNYRDLYYNMPALPVEEVTATLRNKPIQVEIKPLPPLPAVGPAVFSGAVGNFQLSISMDKTALTTNATNQLTMVVTGEGNMQQMRPPVIKWPPGFEAFDPTVKTEEDKSFFPVRSRKIFSYPFVINKPGQYVLPPVSFTYYSLGEARYVTKETPPLNMLVAKGSATLPGKVFNTEGSNFPSTILIIAGALVIALIIGWVWYKERKKSTPKAEAVQPATTPAVDDQDGAALHLMRIRELCPQQNTSEFYKDLYKHTNAFIEARLKIPAHELRQFTDNFAGNRVPLEQLQEILNNCTLGMYTPVYSIDEAMQHRLSAIETLNHVDRLLDSH